MSISKVTLKYISQKMLDNGADKVIFKPLANNDNSKQQIYLGSDFDVIKYIPFEDIKESSIGKKGATFKAPVSLYWMTDGGHLERAPHSQIIMYPDYPEVRLSGILKNCSSARSDLMKPPTLEDRESRSGTNRFMLLGLRKDSMLIYVSAWEDTLSLEAQSLIDNKKVDSLSSVFYKLEEVSSIKSEKIILLNTLLDIYNSGYITSTRLDKYGNKIPYNAKNGAGYTLESLFNIIPNGKSEPDFLSWELKAHMGSAVTLMTPEPNAGTYLNSLFSFMENYGTNKKTERLDFSSIHRIGEMNKKSTLTMYFEGYDPESNKIINTDGGLMLRDEKMQLAAGWSFNKLIDHWKRKHENTCYVSYKKSDKSPYSYHYGPDVTLATGIDLSKFINSIHTGIIYYDPGINMKLNKENMKWRSKKRNQFRVNFNNIENIYKNLEKVNLDEWSKKKA